MRVGGIQLPSIERWLDRCLHNYELGPHVLIIPKMRTTYIFKGTVTVVKAVSRAIY